MHSLHFPPGTTINDVLRVEHDWWRHQIKQSWGNLSAQLKLPPAEPPLSFILNWHDPRRWPMPAKF